MFIRLATENTLFKSLTDICCCCSILLAPIIAHYYGRLNQLPPYLGTFQVNLGTLFPMPKLQERDGTESE